MEFIYLKFITKAESIIVHEIQKTANIVATIFDH